MPRECRNPDLSAEMTPSYTDYGKIGLPGGPARPLNPVSDQQDGALDQDRREDHPDHLGWL